MPYDGDSVFDAWEYWFDEEPSEDIRKVLEARVRAHSAEAVLEAIQITGSRVEITEETNRLKYLSGILRRKALEAIAPERVEEERQIDSIIKYWNRDQVFGWSLSRVQVRRWLQYLSAEAIKSAIRVADSWRDFRELIDDAIEKTSKYRLEQEAAAKSDAEAKAAEELEMARRLTIVPQKRRRRAR